MEDERINEESMSEPERYEPRPMWQVWAARAGLVAFVIFVICQLLVLAGGGL